MRKVHVHDQNRAAFSLSPHPRLGMPRRLDRSFLFELVPNGAAGAVPGAPGSRRGGGKGARGRGKGRGRSRSIDVVIPNDGTTERGAEWIGVDVEGLCEVWFMPAGLFS